MQCSMDERTVGMGQGPKIYQFGPENLTIRTGSLADRPKYHQLLTYGFKIFSNKKFFPLTFVVVENLRWLKL